MKPIAWIAAAMLGLAGGWASAQSQLPMPPTVAPPTQPPPALPPPTQPPPPVVVLPAPPAVTAPVVREIPAPIYIDTKVDMHTNPGPPADLHAARVEAVNALHWAKTEGCRNDPSPSDCVRRAQADHDATMARLGFSR